MLPAMSTFKYVACYPLYCLVLGCGVFCVKVLNVVLDVFQFNYDTHGYSEVLHIFQTHEPVQKMSSDRNSKSRNQLHSSQPCISFAYVCVMCCCCFCCCVCFLVSWVLFDPAYAVQLMMHSCNRSAPNVSYIQCNMCLVCCAGPRSRPGDSTFLPRH